MNNILKLFLSLVLAASALAARAQQVAPEYSILGTDTTCQIFLYSPAPKEGLHLAYLGDDEQWHDVGALFTSSYQFWSDDNEMHDPYVMKTDDGQWYAIWSLGPKIAALGVSTSEDLMTWRPQDYPATMEKGVSEPVVYQMDGGEFDIYFKSPKGMHYMTADKDYRHFAEDSIPAEADDILWQNDKATVGGRTYGGNQFDVPKLQLDYVFSYMASLRNDAQEASRAFEGDTAWAKLKASGKPVEATIDIYPTKTKRISDRLMGIFFEDISFGADGGLYAEMVENRDFEYDRDDAQRSWTATTAWESTAPLKISVMKPLSDNNPHYVVLGGNTLINRGWRGSDGKGSMTITTGESYRFSAYAMNVGDHKTDLEIELRDDNEQTIAKEKIKVASQDWTKYTVMLQAGKLKKGAAAEKKPVHLVITPKKEDLVALDMVSLFPANTFKGRENGVRRDIADSIAALHPRFMRFPGGCLVHGDGLKNIYNWKESIGPLQDRKPDRNRWGYHQTKGLGWQEYFQLCEDLGCEPLPVVAAGVPCQNSGFDAEGRAGQQGGIPMKDMPAYVQDILDMIEWANGDASTSQWARKRAEAGHPAPFNLKMIGIGNEDEISTTFEERYLMIAKAIKEKYPQMEIIGTVGPGRYPSADYVEGWKVADANKRLFYAMDEHYYEQPGWYIAHRDYYDDYARNGVKVYLGEWAAQSDNLKQNALAEALYLTDVERNADVVTMSSYAPLLCKTTNKNWARNMIYFDGGKVETTPSYEVQKMFSTHSGDTYIPSRITIAPELAKYVGASVVKDTKNGKTWLKIVNALPVNAKFKIDGKEIEIKGMSWKAIEI